MCRQSVYMYLGDIDIQLRKDSEVLVKNVSVTLPHRVNHILIKKFPGTNYIFVTGWRGLILRWDVNSVQVELSPHYAGKTCGLCGNFNGIIQDDFTDSNGDLSDSPIMFGNTWKRLRMNEVCEPSFSYGLLSNEVETRYAQLSANDQTRVNEICSMFTPTHASPLHFGYNVIDPEPYYQQCIEDVSRCNRYSQQNCSCNSYSRYARDCAAKDVILDWRKGTTCVVPCVNGTVFSECGSACPATCGNMNQKFNCRHRCIDGCFCPPGMVHHENQCLHPVECPCQHNKVSYGSGETITKGCNKCSCASGKWKCTTDECPGTCVAFGDTHYRSFDNQWFDFDGTCKYVLAKDKATNLFDIIINNVACDPAKGERCAKSIGVHLNKSRILLYEGRKVLVDNTLVMLPYNGPGISIKHASSLFVKLTAAIGLEILYDGGTRVYVTVSPKFINKTRGLCGTFNSMQHDDFKTPEGIVDTNPVTFGNSWNIDLTCPMTRKKRHPCDIQVQKQEAAMKKCNKLRSFPFTDCHYVVDPAPFIVGCQYDFCKRRDSVNGLCAAIAAYTKECADHGVVIDWRNSNVLTECAVTCPPGQYYQECGSMCKTTCQDLSTQEPCEMRCVAGCNCPIGKLKNSVGTCIPETQCPCHYNGNNYPPGSILNREKCEKCICRAGEFQCKIDKGLCGHTTCPGNQIWSNQSVECLKSCETLHLPCFEKYSMGGCVCPNGTVWDTSQQLCIEPTDCPCHYNGRTYNHLESYKWDCNECTCKRNRWECTANVCPGTCSIYGDPHYTTFDGKRFLFEGRCGYILSRALDNMFSIHAENIPCGASICTKSISLKLNDTRISLRKDQEVIVVPTDTQSNQMFTKYHFIRNTFFDIIHSEIGVTLAWDRGTRILITLSPKFKGQTSGLCGNFNGDQMDDFKTRGDDIVINPETFGDSWKGDSTCPDTPSPIHPCSIYKERATWSHKQCNIVNKDLFKACHLIVDPRPYYDACYRDACGCSMGGDCECLCTAVAAYAQACSAQGVHIKWRSQEFCPIQCDTCQEYKSCGPPNPKTCRNLCDKELELPIKCVEGCFCPNDTVSHKGKCIKASQCPCYFYGVEYPAGKMVTIENCQKCVCAHGCIVCSGPTCTTTAPPTTTTEEYTTSTTTTQSSTSSTSTTPAPTTTTTEGTVSTSTSTTHSSSSSTTTIPPTQRSSTSTSTHPSTTTSTTKKTTPRSTTERPTSSTESSTKRTRPTSTTGVTTPKPVSVSSTSTETSPTSTSTERTSTSTVSSTTHRSSSTTITTEKPSPSTTPSTPPPKTTTKRSTLDPTRHSTSTTPRTSPLITSTTSRPTTITTSKRPTTPRTKGTPTTKSTTVTTKGLTTPEVITTVKTIPSTTPGVSSSTTHTPTTTLGKTCRHVDRLTGVVTPGYQCRDRKKYCIPKTWVCNGEINCPLKDDEENCPTTTVITTTTSSPNTTTHSHHTGNVTTAPHVTTSVSPHTKPVTQPPIHCEGGYLCKDSKFCIMKSFVCDGELDCPQKDDEENCTTTQGPTTTQIPTTRISTTQVACKPSPWWFRCKDGSKCLKASKVCDKTNDCVDGSDEEDCPTHCAGCSPGNFKCHKTCQCIPMSYVCDGTNECNDRSDELGCPVRNTTTHASTTASTMTPTPTITCENNKVYRKCARTCSRKCHYILVGCKERTRTCQPGCTCEKGLLGNGTFCVLPTQCSCYDFKLGVYKHAGEKWERDCKTCTCFNDSISCEPVECPNVYCPEPKILIRKPGKCCKECVSEKPKPTTQPPTPTCLLSEFQCDNNVCIPKEWVCDGERDCYNAGDERRCTNPPEPCFEPLGLANPKVISEDSFKASSSRGYLYRPGNARLNSVQVIGSSAGGWCAKRSVPKHWIRVDLGREFIISKVATQGRYQVVQFVTLYKVKYSLNLFAWNTYKYHGNEKIFVGNHMLGNIKYNKLEHPFQARYVQIVLEKYMQSPCMRFELYGCSNSTPPTTSTPTTVTTVTTPCPEFHCDNGQCIFNKLVCDGKIDCSDGSDEKKCVGTCGPKQFKCGSGNCIPEIFRCDGDIDCSDESDEKNCTVKHCLDTQFRCPNGKCILKKHVCDGDKDCPSGADEKGCPSTPSPTTTTPATTTPIPTKCTGFTCLISNICVPREYICDGYRDCFQGEDEQCCQNDTQVLCKSPPGNPLGKCILKRMICDGFIDCHDGSDEMNCTHTTTQKPTTTKVTIITRPTRTTITSKQEKTTAAPTTRHTECPLNSTCICENTCDSLAHNMTGCLMLHCVDDCKCPEGYKRNKKTGYCQRELKCPCVKDGKIYPTGGIVEDTKTCTQCICKKDGWDCGFEHCSITCAEDEELVHPKGKCCECRKKIICRKDQVLSDCPCPRTCSDTKNLTCLELTCKKGCECPHGTFDNGTHCVEISECYCTARDGSIHQPHSHWEVGDCNECKCSSAEIKCGIMCRYNTCPPGFKLVTPPGKCCSCQPIHTTTISTHFTSTSTAYVTPTTPITNGTTRAPIRKCVKREVKELYVDEEKCISTEKIIKGSCHGDCQSTVVSDFIRGFEIRNCSCCKPVGIFNATVTLYCPHGDLKYFNYKQFKECFCRPCDRSPFIDVPLWRH